MLECVVNISEGRDGGRIAAFVDAAGGALLDVHRDAGHHRSVLTLAGPSDEVEPAVAAVARVAVATLDLHTHEGAHPRLGVLDVVPWVDLEDPWVSSTRQSLAARNRFATWAANDLDLPTFSYGPERTLPEVRRHAWGTLLPTAGPHRPHPTAGAVCVGARGLLVAYNLWLSAPDVDAARRVAADLRRPGLRALLGLGVGRAAQVSCNLTDPARLGPAEVYDLVVRRLQAAGPGAPRIAAAELVGLLPTAVLDRIPSDRWADLDVGPERTIEKSRLDGRRA